jgi:protease-4
VKKLQVWLIAGVIALPVLVGLFLLLRQRGQEENGVLAGVLDKVGLVRIEDAIYSSDDYVRQLRSLRTDRSIAGVLLRIDSPGGAAAPSQEIYEEVMRFRTAHKPLVVSMGNVAA